MSAQAFNRSRFVILKAPWRHCIDASPM